jgi:hypothetical protein
MKHLAAPVTIFALAIRAGRRIEIEEGRCPDVYGRESSWPMRSASASSARVGAT